MRWSSWYYRYTHTGGMPSENGKLYNWSAKLVTNAYRYRIPPNKSRALRHKECAWRGRFFNRQSERRCWYWNGSRCICELMDLTRAYISSSCPDLPGSCCGKLVYLCPKISQQDITSISVIERCTFYWGICSLLITLIIGPCRANLAYVWQSKPELHWSDLALPILCPISRHVWLMTSICAIRFL